MSKVRKIIFVVTMVLLIVLNAVPVFAAGTDDDTAQDADFVFSYWHIDNIYARTQDGRQVLFEFPSDFFFKSQISDQVVTLTSTDGEHMISFRFYGETIDNQKYMLIDFEFVQENATYIDIEFTFINNVIYPNNSLIYDPTIPMSWHVPYFWIWNTATGSDITTDTVTSFGSQYNVVMPNPRDDGSVGFDKSSGVYNDLTSTMISYQKYYNLLIPDSFMQTVVSSFKSKGYTDANIAPYFDYCQTRLFLDYYDALNSTMTLFLPVGECSSLSGYLVGSTRVSLWYDKYGNFEPFPSYPETDIDYGLTEITDFFATVVGGIFAMQIFPGIFIGGIAFAVFGLKFVKVAINFFAGG